MSDNHNAETLMVGFLVDERPHVFVNDADANRHFLEGIDRLYWAYQAIIHGEQLESDDPGRRQHAATALRVVYSQGLETLFAFIAALVQSPRFPIGWLHSYQNRDLQRVIRKIHEERAFPCALKDHPSWHAVASLVFGVLAEPKRAELIDRFSRLWRMLAAEFIEERFEPEYNNLKHGMRSHVGGFGIFAGIEHAPGVPVPRERMQPIGGSEYASSFWMRPRKLDGCRFTFELSRFVSSAWTPGQFAAALPLIGMSINNVAARALIVAGADPAKIQFVWPEDSETFEAPWELRSPSINHFDTSHRTDLTGWTEPPADQVQHVYGVDDHGGEPDDGPTLDATAEAGPYASRRDSGIGEGCGE